MLKTTNEKTKKHFCEFVPFPSTLGIPLYLFFSIQVFYTYASITVKGLNPGESMLWFE